MDITRPSKLQMVREIRMLVELGIDSERASFIVYKKYGYDDLAEETKGDLNENEKDLQEQVKLYLVPFETTIEK